MKGFLCRLFHLPPFLLRRMKTVVTDEGGDKANALRAKMEKKLKGLCPAPIVRARQFYGLLCWLAYRDFWRRRG